MKLSDAIDLGRTIETPGSGLSFCSCALGLGMAAMGAGRNERLSSRALEIWPWLGETNIPAGFGIKMDQVSYMYFRVVDGSRTLDQLIEKVREMEPQEIAAHIQEEVYEMVT